MSVLKLKPEQINRLRKFDDRISFKNHNDARHLLGKNFLKTNVVWATGLRESSTNKSNYNSPNPRSPKPYKSPKKSK